MTIPHPDHNNGPTVPGDHAIHLGWRAGEAQRTNTCGYQGEEGSRPPGHCREDVGAETLFFLGSQGIQQKWNKKQEIPKRNNTNSGYSSWFVSSFFQLSFFVLFSSCHLVFFLGVETTSTFIPGQVLLKATRSRKSTLWPHDPTRTVWKSVGQVSKRSSACRLAIRRRESANMVVLPKGATLQIDAWFLEATWDMWQWNWCCFLLCVFFGVWKVKKVCFHIFTSEWLFGNSIGFYRFGVDQWAPSGMSWWHLSQ